MFEKNVLKWSDGHLKIEFRECAASLPFFFFCWGRRMRHLHYAARSLLLGFCWASEWMGFSETTHNYSLVTMNMQALSNQHAQISNGNNHNTCWTPRFLPCSHPSYPWTFYHITNPHRLCPTVRASFLTSVPSLWPPSQMLLLNFRRSETRGTKRMWNSGG